jgi:hypothetical protein
VPDNAILDFNSLPPCIFLRKEKNIKEASPMMKMVSKA